MKSEGFSKICDKFIAKITGDLTHGPEKLNVWSEWLSDYDIIDHQKESIEIPGQYTGLREPVESHIAKISSFN
jgi:hypothetical protein